MCSGRAVVYADKTYESGGVIDAPDDVADRWIANGDAKATLGAKPVRAPRPLTPNQTRR